MEITGVGVAQSATPGGVFRRNENNTQVFLQLLVTQLQNQDPLDPVTNQDFLSQLAQFQSLEEQIKGTQQTAMILLSTTLSSASSLIGREVTVISAQGPMEGLVESVVLKDGVAHIVIGGEEFGLDDIVSIRAA